MTRPFRARFGFDAARNRGINLDRPIDDTDFAQKLWTEERIADGARFRGGFYPDSDGLETPDPDLTTLVPAVSVLTADYWVVARNGRAASGPTARLELGTGDRITAIVNNDTATAVTLTPNPTGLIPNSVYRFDPMEAGSAILGRGLGMLLFTDATGVVNATSIQNPGVNYQVGDTINAVVENDFTSAIETLSAVTPALFQLDPDRTYYTALLTGGAGQGVRANFRTDATGQAISQVFLLDRGAGYIVGDTLTIEIESQLIGSITVASVYSGADVPVQVTIDAVAPGVGWSIITGGGLTRQQADQDYLRLDGENVPSRNIYWNNQQIKDLADPIDDQDAVNLRTLRDSSSYVYWRADQPGHGFPIGQPVAGFWDEATGLYTGADCTAPENCAQFVMLATTPDRLLIIKLGYAEVVGLTLPDPGPYFVVPNTQGQVLSQAAPIIGYRQAVLQRLQNPSQAYINAGHAVYTGFDN